MMKINIVGMFFGTSGYSIHTRSLANAFHELGVDVRVDCPKHSGWESEVNDGELLMLSKPADNSRITIHISTPPSWRLELANNPDKFIGFLVWEGDSIPAFWLPYLNDERVSGIFVPSNHTLEAIGKASEDNEYPIMPPISVVPHGIDLNVFKPRDLPCNKSFTFLVNKGWVHPKEDRGGVQYVIRAFYEEFKPDEPVRLVIKLNPAYIPQGVDHNVWFKAMLKEMGCDDERKNLFVNFDNLLPATLNELYNGADVFVCATRAEAFNIPGLEAKACGLPTIQTGFGGQIEYMNPEEDAIIHYVLEEVTHDIQYEGVKWATPDIKHLRKLMRLAYEEKWHKQDVNMVDWTWRKSAEKALQSLKSI